jgi:hypothetical protein
MEAQGTLIHDSMLFLVGIQFVRTGIFTAKTSDALILIDENNTVAAVFIAGAGRTDIHTGGICALLTHGWQKVHLNIRISARWAHFPYGDPV